MITITTQDIIKYCGENSFNKGRACASVDSFIKIFVQADVLFGLYQGTVGTYRVAVIFEKNIPNYSWCTCPAMSQYDDQCKHIAGMMILWNKRFKDFEELDSWQSLLEDKNKDDLLKLIINAASKSIDVTNALYEELKGEPLLDDEDLYNTYDGW
jgi:uncharacterized Zn finger protein